MFLDTDKKNQTQKHTHTFGRKQNKNLKLVEFFRRPCKTTPWITPIQRRNKLTNRQHHHHHANKERTMEESNRSFHTNNNREREREQHPNSKRVNKVRVREQQQQNERDILESFVEKQTPEEQVNIEGKQTKQVTRHCSGGRRPWMTSRKGWNHYSGNNRNGEKVTTEQFKCTRDMGKGMAS